MPTLGATALSAHDPWALQSRIGLTDARIALDSVLMPRSDLSYIDYRSGVMASGDGGDDGTHMAMRVQAAGGMDVTVEVGNCVINTPGLGAYMCALDTRKTLTLAASSSTTNRTDAVVARVYDDLNPAIGSASGTRKFQVEVWTGDGATGSPTPAEPTVAEGWILLGYVYVAANNNAITSAEIVDMRGPGLVARGGMRALYGADAAVGSEEFAEPGSYPGEQRWVHGDTFQHQVYYGGGSDPATSGWRGVHNCIWYTARSIVDPNPTWIKHENTYEICGLDIPYPGTPYMIYPSARGFSQVSPATVVEFAIRLGHKDGTRVCWCRDRNHNEPGEGDQTLVPNVAPFMYGPFTGPQRVVLTGQIIQRPQTTYGFGIYTTAEPMLSVSVYPSTVQPG